MRKQATSSIIRNSTCRDLGHDWKHGLDPYYRTCTRLHCRAASRFVNGTWIEVTRSERPRTREAIPDGVSSSLWNTPLSQTREVSMPLYPGYDQQRERQAEQRYYKAIADDHYYRATHAHESRGGH